MNPFLSKYAELIRKAQQTQNLMSAGDLDRLESRHFEDCLQLLAVDGFAQQGRLLDIGSGSGMPGLVLACACPPLLVTCLESEKRKTEFIQHVIDELHLKNAQVLRGRAEELAHDQKYREVFDVVTLRACALWPISLELGTAFLKTRGRLYLFASLNQFDQSATGDWTRFSLKLVQAHRYALNEIGHFVIAVFEKFQSTPNDCPRSWKKIKNPG